MIKPENMLPVYPVRNGATLLLDFECFYVDPHFGHNPHFHDHVGWPDPHHPGNACQMKTPRDQFRWLSNGQIMEYGEPVAIDLIKEGYESVTVVLDHPDEEIVASGFIDDELHNLIVVRFDVSLPMFEDKPIDKRFTIFVNSDDQTDAVARAVLSILPGAPSNTVS